MSQDQINSIDRRVTTLEAQRESDNVILLSIKRGQDAMSGRFLAHMEKEESWRWKVAASLIAALTTVCIGLISVIYSNIGVIPS